VGHSIYPFWIWTVECSKFEQRPVKFFADRFKKKFKTDLRQSLQALRTACERAKRTLATTVTASIICGLLYEGHDFMHNISRAMFKNVNDELTQSTLQPVARVLRDASVSKSDVTDIVLVGELSRNVRFQLPLQDLFQ
jgi:L1 cell adhesion molecule like protein